MTVAIEGVGTAEADWRRWLERRDWPALNITEAVGRNVVIVAAHPDDEILGVAGLMMQIAALGCRLRIVWATDGEASHPGSTVFTPGELAELRREESRRALSQLGVAPVATHHLGLPDGRLTDHREALRRTLREVVQPGDLVIAPWELDGHPDHEAAGEVAREVAPDAWRYPIWMWHWAAPDDARVPWPRLRTAVVGEPDTKAAAIAEFVTQVEPLGDAPDDAAILPAHVIAHFVRSAEWIFI